MLLILLSARADSLQGVLWSRNRPVVHWMCHGRILYSLAIVLGLELLVAILKDNEHSRYAFFGGAQGDGSYHSPLAPLSNWQRT